jgi:hypothetical protein
MTYNEIVNLASGSFLCDVIPDDFYEYSDDKQNAWLEANAWEPFEYWEGQRIWKVIDAHASAIQSFIEQQFDVKINK